MIVAKCDEVEAEESKDEIVAQGPVQRKIVIDDKMSEGFGVVWVSFAPGAKLNYHTHPFEQILYVTEGKGIVATRTEERIVTPGSVVFIPPGEDHWHGATEDTPFVHIALYRGRTKLSEM
jgi:quercetin dioxygenase-like cupin family protein